MAQKTGALIFDETADRYDIRFDLNDYYGGLHCGDCFEVFVKEAAEYSNIGINKIDSMLKQPNCPFVLYVGARELVKRKEFEEYIRRELII